MSETRNPTILSGFVATVERVKEVVAPPKIAPSVRSQTDDDKLRTMVERSNLPFDQIAKKCGGEVSGNRIFSYMTAVKTQRIDLSDYEKSAVASVVWPGRVFKGGVAVSGQFKSHADVRAEAEAPLPEIKPSVLRGTSEKLALANAADPSKAEATEVYNLLRNVPDSISVRAIRDGLRQSFSMDIWQKETPQYISDRLDNITKNLMKSGVITVDNEATTTRSGTIVRVHRDRMTQLKNLATRNY